MKEKGIEKSTDSVAVVVGLIKERATFIADFWELSAFFFQKPNNYDEKSLKKQWKENTANILTEVGKLLEKSNDFTSKSLEDEVKKYITENNYGFGQVMPPLRLALVGEMKGPHIFDIMEYLGKEEALQRITNLIRTNS